ncbi:Sialin, partial [Armadillidium vulgare]
GYLPAIGAIILCFTNCNRALALSIFVILGTCLGGQFTGALISHADITPRFAGTAIGLTNTFACIPGFLSPLIVSYLTDKNVTTYQQIRFHIFACLVLRQLYLWITTDFNLEYPKKEEKNIQKKT